SRRPSGVPANWDGASTLTASASKIVYVAAHLARVTPGSPPPCSCYSLGTEGTRMSGFEFEDSFKWQHFAFAADTVRVDELNGAVTHFFKTGDGRAVQSFYRTHAPAFYAAEARVRAEVPLGDVLNVLERARAAYLVGGGDIGTLDRAHARAVAEASRSDVLLARAVWESLRDRSARLERLVELNAPAVITENERRIVLEHAAALFDALPDADSAATNREADDAPIEGAEVLDWASSCLKFCLAPFPENVGIAGGYELLNPVGQLVYASADPFAPAVLMPKGRIPSADMAALHEACSSDALLGPGDAGPVATATGDALRDFVGAIALPALTGVDALAAQSDVPTDETRLRFVSGANEADLAANKPALRSRLERYGAACRAMSAEGKTLLSWIARNGAL
ncbi:MAG: hypothetical protein ACRD6W_09770, partial [Nitrososphaerales archaeon]